MPLAMIDPMVDALGKKWMAAALVLSACSFGAITPMAQMTSWYPARGMLALSDEGDRVYIGVQSLPSGLGNGVKIFAFDEDGAFVDALPAFNLNWETQAIITDVQDDTVLTLHAGGHITRWTKDLVFDTILFDKVTPPAVGVEEFQYCDFVEDGDDNFFATGIMRIGGDWYDAIEDPFAPSGWSSLQGNYGPLAQPRSACPRIDFDQASGTFSALFPDRPNIPSDSAVLIVSSVTCQEQFYDPVMIYLPPDPNRQYADVTAGYNHVMLGAVPIGAGSGQLSMYAFDDDYCYNLTFELQDTQSLSKPSAVALPKTAPLVQTHGAHAWWSGHDSGSQAELGIIGLLE